MNDLKENKFISCIACNSKIINNINIIKDINNKIKDISVCLECKKIFIVNYKILLQINIINKKFYDFDIEQYCFIDKKENIFINSKNILELFRFIINFLKVFLNKYLYNSFFKQNKQLEMLLNNLLDINYDKLQYLINNKNDIIKILNFNDNFKNQFNLTMPKIAHLLMLFGLCYKNKSFDLDKMIEKSKFTMPMIFDKLEESIKYIINSLVTKQSFIENIINDIVKFINIAYSEFNNNNNKQKNSTKPLIIVEYDKRKKTKNNKDNNQTSNNYTDESNEQLFKIKKKLEMFFSKEYFEKIVNNVKKSVKGHDELIELITFQIFSHYMNIYFKVFKKDVNLKRVLSKNMIIKGASGSGKTLICTTIAREIEVPYVVSDCSSTTMVGFVGEDADSSIVRLFEKTNKNYLETELLGIVILDEFDKIAMPKGKFDKTYLVATGGVQSNLLKLLEGTKVFPGNKMNKMMSFGSQSSKKIDTSNILFIAIGVFNNLYINKQYRIDFLINKNNTIDKKNITNLLDSNKKLEEAFENFGIMSELIGRFTSFFSLSKLLKKDYENILFNSDISPLNQFNEFFKYFGYKIIIDKKLTDIIINNSFNSKCGVRTLNRDINSILNKAQINFLLTKKININKKHNIINKKIIVTINNQKQILYEIK